MFKNKYIENCIKENKGIYYLNNSYRFTVNNHCDYLIVDDLGFSKDLNFFKSELQKANIKEFILTETSSGLMNTLHALNSVGIIIKGTQEVVYVNKWKEEKRFKGLLMEVQ
ncbi:hypothetical protein G8S55_08885 [Clostridium botulinum C]|uniref:DUF7698 family protein n=1 Tax=Clostridium botulinum TaxID=1491 RepID=UPI001E64FB40|nr:hypothetical protein [Clostridium botulinum]MCD3217362.1 hypothetical protein [Clostridium botulinum C]